MSFKQISIVKVGGQVLEVQERREQFLQKFLNLSGPKILVHGGGVSANQLAKKLQVPVTMKDGRRITDKNMLEIVTMVYGGKISKELAAALSSRGCPAIGLTGADMLMIKSRKRSPDPIDFGYVGDVEQVDTQAILKLLQAGICPIFAPLSCDDDGQILNTNADTIASEVAKSFSRDGLEVILYFTMDLDGVRSDKDDPSSLLKSLDPKGRAALTSSGAIQGGMLPKLENCFSAKQAGASHIFICRPESLPDAGTIPPSLGTEIVD